MPVIGQEHPGREQKLMLPATRLNRARQQSEVGFGQPLTFRQQFAGHEEVVVGKDKPAQA
jgi:hypothetical protein